MSRNTALAATARAPSRPASVSVHRTSAARTGSPAPTIPSSICCTFHRSRGAITSSTVEQKDFVDQGGPVKPRERFAGGGFKQSERLYGSLKAIDPATGETKVNLRLEYPNSSGALATAGNLVFIGHADGELTAHDAKTLKEVWSYNVGSGINAPPISYSVNGRQYVAVLVGSKQPFFVLQNAPELKNSATASILYVFGL